MQKSPARRAFALIWALVFVLGTVGEAFGVHPCPQHGGETQVEQSAPNPHAGHDAGHGSGHHAPDEQSHGGPCTCEAHCQMGAGVAMPATAPAQIAAGIVGAAPRGVMARATQVALRPPHFLPFAQAPPLIG